MNRDPRPRPNDDAPPADRELARLEQALSKQLVAQPVQIERARLVEHAAMAAEEGAVHHDQHHPEQTAASNVLTFDEQFRRWFWPAASGVLAAASVMLALLWVDAKERLDRFAEQQVIRQAEEDRRSLIAETERTTGSMSSAVETGVSDTQISVQPSIATFPEPATRWSQLLSWRGTSPERGGRILRGSVPFRLSPEEDLEEWLDQLAMPRTQQPTTIESPTPLVIRRPMTRQQMLEAWLPEQATGGE